MVLGQLDENDPEKQQQMILTTPELAWCASLSLSRGYIISKSDIYMNCGLWD